MTPTRTITVSHNAETAHRLFHTPGKCQRIHGHSYRIRLRLTGTVNAEGLLAGIDYGSLKQSFRGFIDTYLDHHLLLNETDPFAGPLMAMAAGDEMRTDRLSLPGLRKCAGDPTTENLAMWIGEGAQAKLAVPGLFSVAVDVDETPSNAAGWSGGVNLLGVEQELTEVLGRLSPQHYRQVRLDDKIPGRDA